MTRTDLGALLAWFRQTAREDPWSATRDPYEVWISEVMLQQTVVAAARGRYQAWLARWPTLTALAAASPDEVLAAWEGLGYPSRARNLHAAAVQLVRAGRTTLPDTEDALRALPGVGPYTAAAIASFAFGRPALPLDANLKRVFQRLEAEALWSPALEQTWRSRWAALVDPPLSREANLAVMQLGQRVCRARAPLCASCPLRAACRACRDGLQDRVPARAPRTVTEVATTAVLWVDAGPPRRWWLARPRTGRFSSLWLLPPAAEPPAGAGVLALSPRWHTYTRYRDRVSPFRAPWTGTGAPPLPEGWDGRWATDDEAAGLGLVSAYRAVLRQAMSV